LFRKPLKIAWLTNYPVLHLEPELKIARQVSDYHPCSWVVNLSDALGKRNDVELHLVTESHLVSKSQVVKIKNITFHVLKSGIPFTNHGFPSKIPFEALTQFYFNRKRLVREVQRIKPDLVHAFGTESSYAFSGLQSNFPCLISIQGIINEIVKIAPSFRYQLISRHEKQTIQKNRYFSCRTDLDTNFISSLRPDAVIFKVSEAMNPLFFNNKWQVADIFNIIYVGSLYQRKGIEILIEAVAEVKKSFSEIKLIVVGGGSLNYLHYLKSRCQSLQIEKNVEFIGQKSATEIAQYHQRSQILVLPSEIDNSPNAVAEAMVSGVPVIATNVGGIPSMIHSGETGLLVPSNNVIELARAITFLLSNPDVRVRLSEKAQKIARQRHLPETVAEQTIQAYHKILDLEN
jgi:glycosyltransferase involved in cell wall biosynthesis